jgi:hypothetical protein
VAALEKIKIAKNFLKKEKGSSLFHQPLIYFMVDGINLTPFSK